MIKIEQKTKCCGCTACYNVCPKNAIVMQEDFEGFLYPRVVTEKCIDCGACEKVCPVIHTPIPSKWNRVSYALRVKNSEDILSTSTSGGFITPLAEHILNNRGMICAASYAEDFTIKHVWLEMSKGVGTVLKQIRGSKYVQSNLGDCFSEIKKNLEKDKTVCFIGTTCQVSGLKTFLKKQYEKLITVDLVCHGTPSPKLWSKYLSYQKEIYGSEITEISFRNKTYGYHSGTMRIHFENGKEYYGSARVDYMLKSFFREIASRPICYECPFKTLERCSYFTIFDCWSFSQLVAGLSDDDKGYTNVIVQSEKGARVLEELKNRYDIYPVNTNQAVKLDGIMVMNVAKPHPQRSEFYKELDKRTLPEHIQQFIPISKKDRIIEGLKLILYRLGIYGLIRKIVR